MTFLTGCDIIKEGHRERGEQMPNMKYKKEYRNAMVIFFILLLVLGIIFTLMLIAEIDLRRTLPQMKITSATVTDIRHDYRRRGGYVQEIQILYSVEGEIYERELKSDTLFAPEAGWRTNYSEGDQLEIYYDPDDPSRIATELISKRTAFFMLFSLAGFVLFLIVAVKLLQKRKENLIPLETYRAEEAARKQKKREEKQGEKEAVARMAGQRIRVQYFNIVLLLLISAGCLAILMIGFNTLFRGSGTVFSSVSEIISLFLVIAVLTSPIWILALFNRRFFGRTLCIVGEEGLLYRGRRIQWERIAVAEYDACLATRVPGRRRGNTGCGVRLLGEDLDLYIEDAPLLILRKLKKRAPHIKIRLTKGTMLLYLSVLPGLILLALVMSLLFL